MQEKNEVLRAALLKPPKLKERSDVFDWLWARYDEFGDQLKARGFDWDNLAIRLGESGVRDGRGNMPTGKTVAGTFYKIRMLKGDHRRKRRASKPKPQITRAFQRNAA